ncbi:MAG TPA: glycosyltransferase family 2 protein [Bacteroidota bacterium]|nr:glycosyltransferase family 2 protein [Bacteroidota bacterium]
MSEPPSAPAHGLPQPGPVVSVLVTNWNGMAVLGQCLQSVIDRTRGLLYEIIVVDDASTDGSAAMVRARFPQVRLVERSVNGGFVRANNEGVRHAIGRYVLLLNSDTVLLNDALTILAAHLDAHAVTGICGGWLTDPGGASQVSYGSFPSFSQGCIDALFLNDLFPSCNLPNRGVRPRPGAHEHLTVDYVTGAALMCRRELIGRIGLFDERFQAYCEEVDFCFRALVEGLATAFVPAARILHYGGTSYGRLGRKKIQIHYTSYNVFLVKHHGRAYAFATRLLYAFHFSVKFVVRTGRFVISRKASRPSRGVAIREALYIVLYSLRPGYPPDRS